MSFQDLYVTRVALLSGMSFQDLYVRCRESFLVNSDQTLRAQLVEFRDHKLIRAKKVCVCKGGGGGGGRCFVCVGGWVSVWVSVCACA